MTKTAIWSTPRPRRNLETYIETHRNVFKWFFCFLLLVAMNLLAMASTLLASLLVFKWVFQRFLVRAKNATVQHVITCALDHSQGMLRMGETN